MATNISTTGHFTCRSHHSIGIIIGIEKKTRMVVIVVWLAHNEKIINKLFIFLEIFKEINKIEREKKVF